MHILDHLFDTTTTAHHIPRDDELTFDLVVKRRERLLLILAGLFLLVAHGGLILARGYSPFDMWHYGAWVCCAALGHLVMNRHAPRRDPFLFPIVMLLAGWGLSIIDRLTPFWATRQTAWLIVSLGALLVVIALPGHLRWLSRYRYLWLTGGLFLLGLTIVFGRNPTSDSGLRLWLGIPDIYVQPSELLKLALVAFMASYLADHRGLLDLNAPRLGPIRLPSLRFVAPLLLICFISVLVFLWQRDLGAAALFVIVFVVMLYLTTGRVVYVIGGVVMLALASAVAYSAFDVVRARVDVWLNPWPRADDTGFQVVQSLMSFSAGGVLGQGAGQGSPTYVPVAHSDFIFAAIGEEWGLLGSLVVMSLIMLVVLRGLRLATALQARVFRSLLAAGISVTLAVQSLLIMGGTLKLIPLTGITLPFMSYGGSSLLTCFVMTGLLLAMSAER
jgi:cell division protein FtsW (lipid II flippase)